jgi:hypothetical protein
MVSFLPPGRLAAQADGFARICLLVFGIRFVVFAHWYPNIEYIARALRTVLDHACRPQTRCMALLKVPPSESRRLKAGALKQVNKYCGKDLNRCSNSFSPLCRCWP